MSAAVWNEPPYDLHTELSGNLGIKLNDLAGRARSGSLTITHHDTRTVVQVGGDLDVYSASTLRNVLIRLDAAARHRIALDLVPLEFMDSTGLGVIIGAAKRATEGGGGLCIVGASERVLKTFRVTGLLRVIPAFADLAAGFAWLDAQ